MSEENKTAAPKLVAVDDGYAQMKLYGEAPDGDGVAQLRMKSAIAVGRRGIGNIDGTDAIDVWRTEEGQDFSVSDKIETEGTQLDSFHFSEMDRVLINHALYRGGYAGAEVTLLAGLPVANYFIHGSRNADAIERKRHNLLKGVSLTSSDVRPARIVDVQIGCQAVAAYVDWMLDDDLNEVNDPGSRIAIVDIGGRTTDIATVIGGREIDHDRSGTANIGVLDVYRAIEKAIHIRFQVQDRFPLTYLDSVVRTRKAKIFGRIENLSEIVDTALSEQEAKIRNECERKLQQAATLDAVVFVGGGSALFSRMSEMFRNGVMIRDPEIANARGLFKFFRWKAKMAAARA